MKLVEIKNNLAKLYYEPSVNPLVLSDFLLIDDENKPIIAQVVSIETTNNHNINCAVLRFSLDKNKDNTYSAYSGYTPPLSTSVTVIDNELLKTMFLSSSEFINVGKLTSSSRCDLNLDSSLLDNFLYIQSDRIQNIQNIFTKILTFNKKIPQKTLIVDFCNVFEFANVPVIQLGKEFKLPVSSEILNYIYEHDLTELTVEQKAIVQDIILELQAYIATLEQGFIPFNTLLDVVNSIYEADKSVAIILFRNKLLKYQQQNLFASDIKEIISLIQAIENYNCAVFNLSSFSSDWQQEALRFVLDNFDDKLYLLANVSDSNLSKGLLCDIYKHQSLVPVLASKYEYDYSIDLKSFAKNIMLFRPEQPQKTFAAYSSFLNNLNEDELIVSGVNTFFTPLIVGSLAEKLSLDVNNKSEILANEVGFAQKSEAEIFTTDSSSQNTGIYLEESDFLALDDISSEAEVTLEDEIAKDVDKMFYGDFSSDDSYSVDGITDADLDVLDTLNSDEKQYDNLNQSIENIETEELLLDNEVENIDESDELPGFSGLDVSLDVDSSDKHCIDTKSSLDELFDAEKPQPAMIDDTNTSVPVYTTELPTDGSFDTVKISEGNIVYHQKYGKGVVESIFSYGKRTLCTIQFDESGRKLLDPNVAKLEQV